ncbi:COG4315 family predicted lipoprotein [Actinoplanes friuliensis]|uniref:Lipoprotein n=1 Tax=Actinoplanes friuliensis DSM 7358 TaxID=1246995 RepID=U5VSY6_9ACTN|nr:lipoprotein [Actinoplanes friuliensis]AGZ38761.1 lipoprotein [Actinoplanes friuliensis DSM 7358]
MKRSRTVFAAVALTSALGLAACARTDLPTAVNYVAADDAPAEPTADPTGVPEPAIDTEKLAAEAEERAEEPEPEAAPIPEPTVAKTQKWVKIFSGASDEDITPPKSIRKGSKTVELNTAENKIIGTYVTDGAGRTLYRFDEDSNKPPEATCNGDCAKAWPPLLIKSPGKIFPQGLNPKILGYVERADGTCQVTINGWPVYYFAKDKKAGDINGQGVKGTWFAIDPKGGKTGDLPESAGGTGGNDSETPPEDDAPTGDGY